MALTINTNLGSINGQRNLNSSSAALSTSMTRLSSGVRVNSAKDDAAGLAIADRMNSQVRGMTVAVRNANDGVSLTQAAESSLGSMTETLQRMRDIAIQSSNEAGVSLSDRAKLNTEYQFLNKELSRIIENSDFNGKKILRGDLSKGLDVQVGSSADTNSRVKVTIPDMSNLLTDLKDSKLSKPIVGNNVVVSVSTPSTSQSVTTTVSQPATTEAITSSVTKQDEAVVAEAWTNFVLEEAVNDTWWFTDKSYVTRFMGADAFYIGQTNPATGKIYTYEEALPIMLERGKQHVADYAEMAQRSAAAYPNVPVEWTNAWNNTTDVFMKRFEEAFHQIFSTGVASFTSDSGGTSATSNGNDALKLRDAAYTAYDNALKNLIAKSKVSSTATSTATSTSTASASATPSEVKINDSAMYQIPLMKATDSVSAAITEMNNGAMGSAFDQAKVSIIDLSDIYPAGALDLATRLYENLYTNDNTLSVAANGIAKNQFVNDDPFIKKLVAKNNSVETAYALSSIDSIDKAIESIDIVRSNLGSTQNRFTTTIANLQNGIENQSAAKSRIMDADFAVETANLSRAQILQQAGTAMLAQANQSGQTVMALLR